MSQLAKWESFYVIVGSAGAALIGIQFVVITLIASLGSRHTSHGSISAFATPNVVHFGGALLISALMSAPWPSLSSISVALALCGLIGLVYSATVIRRARHQTTYEPTREDWLWYVLLPCGIYAALALAALFLRVTTQLALFVIGAVALGLLLLAIRNAWDTVTYVTVANASSDARKAE